MGGFGGKEPSAPLFEFRAGGFCSLSSKEGILDCIVFEGHMKSTFYLNFCYEIRQILIGRKVGHLY